MPSEEQINEIAKMTVTDERTGLETPDTEAQIAKLQEIRAEEIEANAAAIEEQNNWAELNKVCYARPVAGSEFSDYDAYMHLQCGNSPDGYTRLMVTDFNRNQKCIGCGFIIGNPHGN